MELDKALNSLCSMMHSYVSEKRVGDAVAGLPVAEYKALVQGIEKRISQYENSYADDVRSWTDTASSDPNLADFCDNEVRASSRYYHPAIARGQSIIGILKKKSSQ